ncbi:DUF4326 domain-containing protein [Luteimicrobium sp. NPDC057192]|uniref:DUF4326 domain-containing protein n=1 Tax=Luteimicrobium sp. NPDC057192 TaxID=3346042 RepID=UPI00363F071D
MTPQRIQLRRTKGWRKPEGAIVVARPSRWGNRFVVGSEYEDNSGRRFVRTAEDAVRDYRRWLTRSGMVDAILARKHLPELRGHDLACWCKPGDPCHADVLLELANGDLT